MQIRYINGDLLAGDHPLIVHGCNALGAFDAGVAGQIRRRFPVAFQVYRQAYLDAKLRLGSVLWAIDIAEGRPRKIIGNAITQQSFGPGDRQYVDYDAIRQAIHEVDDFVDLTQDDGTERLDCFINIEAIGPIDSVAMPLLGSGLGGGKWSIISDIIEQESRCFQPIVYLFDGKMPAD